MSLEYVTTYKGVQFYCTTVERAFGPVMPDEDTGARFCRFIGTDPRRIAGPELDAKWNEFSTIEEAQEIERLQSVMAETDHLAFVWPESPQLRSLTEASQDEEDERKERSTRSRWNL
jgi:hypothetical protein